MPHPQVCLSKPVVGNPFHDDFRSRNTPLSEGNPCQELSLRDNAIVRLKKNSGACFPPLQIAKILDFTGWKNDPNSFSSRILKAMAWLIFSGGLYPRLGV